MRLTRSAAPGAPTPRRRVRNRSGVLGRVDAEWARLVEDPVTRSACRRWASSTPALAGVEDLDDVLERVPTAPDAVLGDLLGRVAAGETLAGRVVLQALLPKMVRLAALDRAADAGDYLTALWCEIATYPIGRRPTSVAANLALDTLKAVHRDRGGVPLLPTDPGLLARHGDEGRGSGLAAHPPSAVVVLQRARELRVLDAATSELLRSVYAEGLSGLAAAERHGLSPGAVRTRCSRALKVLASHAEMLADAG